MSKKITVLLISAFFIIFLTVGIKTLFLTSQLQNPPTERKYWLKLYRKSQKEVLFIGKPGDADLSNVIKTFKVKTGIPGQRPTPLPQKLGKEYWLIINKFETKDSQETAPYFLTLNIPYTEDPPYGPSPYDECNGQCNWEVPGSFGLHGVAGNSEKLSAHDPGSSGCVRHSDEDITYLYNLLNPEQETIRYYIEES